MVKDIQIGVKDFSNTNAKHSKLYFDSLRVWIGRQN